MSTSRNPRAARQSSVIASTGSREGEVASLLRSESDSTYQDETSGSNLVRTQQLGKHRQGHERTPLQESTEATKALSSERSPGNTDTVTDASEVQSKSSHQRNLNSEGSVYKRKHNNLLSFGEEIEEGDVASTDMMKIGNSAKATVSEDGLRAKSLRSAEPEPAAATTGADSRAGAIHSAASAPVASTSGPSGGVSVLVDDDDVRTAMSSAASLARLSVGVHQAIGSRKTMEDRHTIISNLKPIDTNGVPITDGLDRCFVGVYDGHNGSQSAEQLQTRLHLLLAHQPALAQFHCGDHLQSRLEPGDAVSLAFKKVFQDMDDEILRRARREGARDGSTACVMLQLGTLLYVAHTGDSRAVLCRNGKSERLSEDHKPNNPSEKQRIEAAGGTVEFSGCWRVICRQLYSGLAVARAFGDINFKDPMRLVECEPDVRRVRLQPSDEFVVMASDGLWDVMDDQEACRVVIDELQGAATSTAVNTPKQIDEMAHRAARALVREAMHRYSSDNVTVMVILLCWG